ncbi:MAG: FAD-binding oxidoreductase [Hyphomicrobium sp.]|jgi:FAD/FMN-containing dehydrogenase
MARDLADLVADLGDIPVLTDPARCKQRSRDFFWYSPRLKPVFEGVTADLVVLARSEEDVLATIRACWRHDVPLTVRGAGTGNYGQAMPLKGGVVLDLSELTGVLWLKPGSVRAKAGTRLHDIEGAANAQGQELRLFPSTRRSATVGGFIAGGSSGIGAVNWGLLRDRGNIIALRVLTMEEAPRVLELRGDEIQKVNHAYGTNGIITEVELALASFCPWIDTIITFQDFGAALRFGQALVEAPGIFKKTCALLPAPIPQSYFTPLANYIKTGRHSIFTLVAPQSSEALEELVKEMAGEICYRKTAAEAEAERLLPLYEFTWNHTTMWALRHDKSITYLQTLFPVGQTVELVERLNAHFGDEVMHHLEFVRAGGGFTCFGIQLVRYTTDERLDQIMQFYDSQGCTQFDPHAYTLEEGGMKQIDLVQLNFKKEADPKGLLNPGKMRAWDDPRWAAQANRAYLYAAS